MSSSTDHCKKCLSGLRLAKTRHLPRLTQPEMDAQIELYARKLSRHEPGFVSEACEIWATEREGWPDLDELLKTVREREAVHEGHRPALPKPRTGEPGAYPSDRDEAAVAWTRTPLGQHAVRTGSAGVVWQQHVRERQPLPQTRTDLDALISNHVGEMRRVGKLVSDMESGVITGITNPSLIRLGKAFLAEAPGKQAEFAAETDSAVQAVA